MKEVQLKRITIEEEDVEQCFEYPDVGIKETAYHLIQQFWRREDTVCCVFLLQETFFLQRLLKKRALSKELKITMETIDFVHKNGLVYWTKISDSKLRNIIDSECFVNGKVFVAVVSKVDSMVAKTLLIEEKFKSSSCEFMYVDGYDSSQLFWQNASTDYSIVKQELLDFFSKKKVK